MKTCFPPPQGCFLLGGIIIKGGDYYTILYYTILYYTILYYTITYSTKAFYTEELGLTVMAPPFLVAEAVLVYIYIYIYIYTHTYI